MVDNQQVWEDVYKLGKQSNSYPYGDLPSYIFMHYGKDSDKGAIRVLEVGSGGGGNLWFFAREGFDIYGIEFSQNAVETSKKLLGKEGLSADIRVGDFTSLPYEDSFFDLVLDRNSLYCVEKKDLLKSIDEIKRVLKKGGRFLSFMYSAESECIKYGEPRKLEKNTYTDFKTRPFKDAGITHFVTTDELKNELYKDFTVEYIKRTTNDFVYPKAYNDVVLFITSGVKN